MSLIVEHLAKLAAKNLDMKFLTLVALTNVVILHGDREWVEIEDEHIPNHGAKLLQIHKIIDGFQSNGHSLHTRYFPIQDEDEEADMTKIRVPTDAFQKLSPRSWKSSPSTEVTATGTRPYVEAPAWNGTSTATSQALYNELHFTEDGFHDIRNRPIKHTSRSARESPMQADIPPSGAKVASVSPWAIKLPSVRNHDVSHKHSELPAQTVVKEPYHSYQLEYVKGLVGRVLAPSFPSTPPLFQYLDALFQRNHNVSGASAMNHLKLNILLQRNASNRATFVLTLCLVVLPLLVIAAAFVIATADDQSLHQEQGKSESSALIPTPSQQSSPQAAGRSCTPKIPQVISSSTQTQNLPDLSQHLLTPLGRQTTLLFPTLKPSGGEIAIGTTKETLFLAQLGLTEHTHVPNQCDDAARDMMVVRLLSADGNVTLARYWQGPHGRVATIHNEDGRILGTMHDIAGQCTFVVPSSSYVKFEINWVSKCVEITGEAGEMVALCTSLVEGTSYRYLFIGPGVDPTFIVLGILGLDLLNPWA